MIAIPQSTTRRILLKAYLSSDHVSVATGKTIVVKISKNGAAFGDPSAGATNATEIANGWYYVDLSTTDTGTGGPIIIRGTCSGVDDVETYRYVADPHNAGFDGVPAVTAGSTNGLPLAVDGSGRVDVLKINGTSQTARDLGASVLLSAGTGTGQLDFTSGVVKANFVQILATALTETAGQLAAGFKQFFNIASPTSTMNTITTVTTTTTATNLTNAPTSGDFTATMKTSLNAATPTVTAGTVSDKTGYSLASLDAPALESGTAQAGAAGTITLRSAASATDNLYRGQELEIYGGTGAGQARVVTGYVGSTKVATVDENWITNPDNTSTYRVKHRTPKLDSSQQVTAASVQGNVTGSVASVSGAVGSVTGAVGSVTGAVGSVTGNVGGNVVGTVASVVGAVGSVTAAVTAGTVSDKTGYALTSAYDAAKTAAQAGNAMTITDSTTLNAVADALLKRDMSAVTGEAAHSLLNILRGLGIKNKTSISNGVLTVFKEDGVTTAFTVGLTTNSGALPVVGTN